MATDLESSRGGNPSGSRAGADASTRELPAAPVTGSEDRCTACGAPLAHDQRYCVQCGERRGQSRFPAGQPATEAKTGRTRAPRQSHSQRVSSGTTLVAGVGVLLLAIGLGVLIGRIGQNNSSNQRATTPPPQVIIPGGAGSGSATGAAATTPTTITRTTAAPSVSHGLSGKLKKAAAATAPPPKAVQQKATQAAGKVLGNSSHLASPTTKVGGSCTSGQAGCSGGTFNGNFFGQ